MTLKECYIKMNADYDSVLYCLGTEERVYKFLLKLLDDKTFSTLCEAFDTGNAEEAFRAAHSLKGVCLNLSLKHLQGPANMLTEELRGNSEIGPGARILFEELKALYAETLNCIREIQME